MLVVGDICLDRDCIVEEGVQSAEKIPGKAMDISVERWQPGGGGNLAGNFSSLGATTTVVGTWDRWSKERLKSLLSILGICDAGMVMGGRTPIFEKDYLSDGTQVARRNVCSVPLQGEVYEALCAKIRWLSRAVDLIAVADYDEWGNGVVSPQVLGAVVATGRPTFGSSRQRLTDFHNFDFIIGKSREICCSPAAFLRRSGSGNLIMTLDDKGSAWYANGENGFKWRVRSPKVKGNSCGAGDSFFAAFALAVMSGSSIKEAMKVGNAAGRCCVRKDFGAHRVSLEKLREELHETDREG